MLNSYVALDIETTGLNPAKDNIIEVGAIRIENGTVTVIRDTIFRTELRTSPESMMIW